MHLQADPKGKEAVCDLVIHLYDTGSMRQNTWFRFPFVFSSEMINSVSVLDSKFCIDEVLIHYMGILQAKIADTET